MARRLYLTRPVRRALVPTFVRVLTGVLCVATRRGVERGRRIGLLLGASALALGCASSWGGSIGAVLVRDNKTGQVIIREAPDGRPAAKAGLLPGDEIVAIEGRPVRQLSAEQVHTALEGPVGSKVRLTVAASAAASGGSQVASDPAMREVKIERGPLDHP